MPNWILDLADLWLQAPTKEERKSEGRGFAMVLFLIALAVFIVGIFA